MIARVRPFRALLRASAVAAALVSPLAAQAIVAPEPAPTPVAEDGLAPGLALRHFTNNIQGYRLAGEIDASEWPIYVTAAQAQRKLRFQLGYLAAVSVMPEASTLTLTINDALVGEAAIRFFNSVESVSFDIPEGLLQPGLNSVRITASQRHRVDCTLAATRELWTQIDPIRTGLVLNATEASIDSLADLGAAPPDEQGALPIRLVLEKDAPSEDMARALRLVEMIAIEGRFEQPVVEIGPPASGRYGINLVVGNAKEVAARLDGFAAGDGPRAVVLPARAGRRTTIVVTGADNGQIEEAIKLIKTAAAPVGSPSGLRAAAASPGLRLDGAERVKLADLGIASQEFSGRLFRAGVNIFMPSDFYPADYARATLRLAGGYAAGLAPGAQLVVNVDGRAAVSLLLPKASGDVFKDNPLPLPLGSFKPGLNRIEIEAQTQTPDDAACDPLAAIGAPSRFLMLGDSELELPAMARIGRAPDLAVTATGGFPYADAAVHPKLYLPSRDDKSIGAGMTIAAHLALAAGRPIDFSFTSTPPLKGEGPTLAVAPFSALKPELLASLDIPAAQMREAWNAQIDRPHQPQGSETLPDFTRETRNRLVLQKNFPIACQEALPPKRRRTPLSWLDPSNVDYSAVGALTRELPNVGAATARGERDLFGEWSARLHGDDDWLRRASEQILRSMDWAKDKFGGARVWASRRLGKLAASDPMLTEDELLLVGQGVIGESARDVWTVVTAPNAEELAENVRCLVDPRIARQISGRLSFLDAGEARIDATPAENSRFIPTQPFSLGNIRLIAAGWLSLHPPVFVLAALTLASLLAFATRLFVRKVGRRTQ